MDQLAPDYSGFSVYLDLGRVLEKKPINWMECEVHYISTKTN
jgi:hypothetical protein